MLSSATATDPRFRRHGAVAGPAHRPHLGGYLDALRLGNRGVAELLDTRRLQALYRIGVDEVCYRHPHRYLTIVGDHDTDTVIDIQPGRSEESLANFYQSQPDSIVSQIEVVSMDVSKADSAATRTHAPQATICYDPFHIMQWVNRALDRVYAEAATGPGRAAMSTPDWKATRWALPTRETNSATTNAPWSTRSPAPTVASAGPGPSTNSCAMSIAPTIHPAAPASICAVGSPRPNAAASTPAATATTPPKH
jgi:Transposase